MALLVGPHVHDQIMNLISSAQRHVYIVSPFVAVWDDLVTTLAEARGRGVRLVLVTRGGRDGRGRSARPKASDLRPFFDLGARVDFLPGLHAKLYVSESEAIVASANLTSRSLGNSWECGTHVRRDEHEAAWMEVMEALDQTFDELGRRAVPRPKVPYDVMFEPGKVRELALEGDIAARRSHSFCIVCNASVGGRDVICSRCFARAYATGIDVELGSYCAACGGDFKSTPEEPYCVECLKTVMDPAFDDQRPFDRDPAAWYCRGRHDTVEGWSALSDQALRPATRRRFARLEEARWVHAQLTGGKHSLDALGELLACADSHVVDVAERGWAWERRVGAPPACPFALVVPREDQYHVGFTARDSRPDLQWEVKDALVEWDVTLPALRIPSTLALWAVLTHGARVLGGAVDDPDSSAFGIDVQVSLPAEDPVGFSRLLRPLVSAMLGSMIRHEGHRTELLVQLLSLHLRVGDDVARRLLNAPVAGLLGSRQLFNLKRSELEPEPVVNCERVACGHIARAESGAGRWGVTGRIFTVRRHRPS